MKTVTFEDQDRDSEKVERKLVQGCLSGETNGEKSRRVRDQHSGSELSELAIHTLLVETRARDLDREVDQDPDSDHYLVPSESLFDNAVDDLETIAVSKRSINLLPQKEVVRTDFQPFKQETQPLAMIWCVKMEEDKHQPNELNSQMRVMKTYLKARKRLSDLLRAQRSDRMTSNLKRWIENGAPDKGDLEEDSYRILRQYFMQKEGRLYLNKDGIVACKRREEDKVLSTLITRYPLLSHVLNYFTLPDDFFKGSQCNTRRATSITVELS